MIRILDLLYISLAISALVFAGFSAYAAYQIAATVKKLKTTVERLETTSETVKANLVDISDGLKYGILSLINKLITGKKGGEEKND
jgi:hypothetical protein